MSSSNQPHNKTRQPKLRSSCDGCGAAKLKCDRGQPECGRCLSAGIQCVYGESRKFGRPARQKLSAYLATPPSPSPSSRSGQAEDNPSTNRQNSTTGNNDSVWGAGDDSNTANAVMSNLDASDGSHLQRDLDLLGPTPSLLDLGEWAASDFWSDPHNFNLLVSADQGTGPASSSESPGFGSSPLLIEHPFGPLPRPVGTAREHDCLREAHDILGNLSILSVGSKEHHHHSSSSTSSESSSSSSPSSSGCKTSVPLDHVLRMNREASDRLSRLLVCSCDRSPHLQLLYASIISRVLVWYQQATDCSSSHHQVQDMAGLWSNPPLPAAAANAMVLQLDSNRNTNFNNNNNNNNNNGGSASASSPATGGRAAFAGSSSGNNTAASSASTATWIQQSSLSSTGLAVAPAAMAIGTFNVDDLGMQAALKIQLLSGEMRRAGRLIDLFTSFHSNGLPGAAGQCSLADVSTFGGVGNLYQILDSWLRGEHLRIANLMRARLRELNADLN